MAFILSCLAFYKGLSWAIEINWTMAALFSVLGGIFELFFESIDNMTIPILLSMIGMQIRLNHKTFDNIF
jgi:hypothetical protein